MHTLIILFLYSDHNSDQCIQVNIWFHTSRQYGRKRFQVYSYSDGYSLDQKFRLDIWSCSTVHSILVYIDSDQSETILNQYKRTF